MWFLQTISLISHFLISLRLSSFKVLKVQASMVVKKAARLAKMNAPSSRRGTSIFIIFSYKSIPDMLNERGDEYPSISDLDSYDHSNNFHDLRGFRRYNKLYNMPSNLELRHPKGGGDRICHWNSKNICVYRDAIMAGLRFPFQEFIIKLLVDVQIQPCQIVPNGLRGILCFMVLCIRKNIPLSVAFLRNFFSLRIVIFSLWVEFTSINAHDLLKFLMVYLFLRTTPNGGMSSCF